MGEDSVDRSGMSLEEHQVWEKGAARIKRHIQAQNMAMALLDTHERQVLDTYYEALARRVDQGVLKKSPQEMEKTLDQVPKPEGFDQIEAKLADYTQLFLESGLVK